MKEGKLEKIWTKSFINISITQFLIFTVFYALLTTLPIYVINTLGESQANAGLVVTVMLISAIIIRLFSAKILDLLGKKRGLLFSVILFTLTTFLYIWISSFIPLLIVRFIHGISFGIVTTATGAIAADIVPKTRRGAGMGYFAMSMNLAIVAGPFIGLTLLQFVSFKTLFIVLNALMILSVVTSLNVQITEKIEVRRNAIELKLKLSDLIEFKAIRVTLISGLIGVSYASILSFVSVYAEEIGLSSVASYFFLVFAVVMIASRPSLGRAFDEKGPRFVIIPSLLIFASGLLLLGYTMSGFSFLIAAGLIGLGYGSLLPGFQTLAIQSTSMNRSSHAISTFFVFYDIGIALGAFVWGLIIAHFGYDKMYYMSAILVFIIAFIFHMYWNRRM